MTAVRRDVEELLAVVRRARAVKDGTGLYAPKGHQASGRLVAQAKAMAHELDTLAAIVGRLDAATTPAARKRLGLPTKGSVARTVLEVLHVDALGHSHGHLADLVGLTDAELVARITGAGANTVRPRRLDLVRAGWVEVAGQTGDATRWTLTADGLRALNGLDRRLVTHLMADSLLDACGTAPPGSLSVVTQRELVDCLACLQLPVELIPGG